MNPALVGGYVEGAVRSLIRRYLLPLRTCHGAVIDQENIPAAKDLPQLDVIAWTPLPVPAVFEAGEFAVVPRGSSVGVLEVKSSLYDGAKASLQAFLDPERVKKVTADYVELSPIVQFPGLSSFLPALGVVCILAKGQALGNDISQLRTSGQIAVLFEENEKFEPMPQTRDIYVLINFLAALRLRAYLAEGRVGIDLDALRP
jgi:hypothetical protein